MTETITIERIQSHADAVHPGLPAEFTAACQPGDGIWQGDLGLEIVEKVPNGYTAGKTVVQLVPGDTQGARHCLDSAAGVKMFFPPNGSALLGPCLKTKKEVRVLHPTHGAVTIPAGIMVLCRYQREWDQEQRKQRRAMD